MTFAPLLSSDDEIFGSGLVLLGFDATVDDADKIDDSVELELLVVFVMTLVGMGKLNRSFGVSIAGVRGIVSSFVSNGFRNAFGPCALDNAEVLLPLLALPPPLIGLDRPRFAKL